MGVCSLNHDTATSYELGHTPVFLKFTPPPPAHVIQHKDAPIMPIHSIQHLKVLKHVLYIQYGCGMQSMGVCSLQ
jgi:hypothetical protein